MTDIVKFFADRGARGITAAQSLMDVARSNQAEAGLMAFYGIFAPTPDELRGSLPWLTPPMARAWVERMAQDLENISGFRYSRSDFHVNPIEEFRGTVARVAHAVMEEASAPAVPVAISEASPPPEPEKAKPPVTPAKKAKASPAKVDLLDGITEG